MSHYRATLLLSLSSLAVNFVQCQFYILTSEARYRLLHGTERRYQLMTFQNDGRFGKGSSSFLYQASRSHIQTQSPNPSPYFVNWTSSQSFAGILHNSCLNAGKIYIYLRGTHVSCPCTSARKVKHPQVTRHTSPIIKQHIYNTSHSFVCSS